MILNIEHNGRLIKSHGFCAKIEPILTPIACTNCVEIKPHKKELFTITMEQDCYQDIKINIDH